MIPIKEKSSHATFILTGILLLSAGFFGKSHAMSPDKQLEESARSGSITQVQAALDSGANINGEQGTILTPLSWAARNHHNDVVQLLIDGGADPDATEPIYQAAWYGNANGIELLLEAGANFDPLSNSSKQTLIKAAKNGWGNVIQLLFQNGVTAPTEEEMSEKELPDYAKKIIRKNNQIFESYKSTIKESLKGVEHSSEDTESIIMKMLGLKN